MVPLRETAGMAPSGEDARLVAVLQRVPLFASLPDEHVVRIGTQMVRREIAREALVTVEGQVAGGLYVIVSGRFKRFKIAPNGHEQILKFLGSGESFGEVPLLDGGSDPASTEAMEPDLLYVLPRARFETLIHECPDVALGLIQVLAGRIRHFTELVEDLSFRHRIERVAKLILERCAAGDLGRLTQSDMGAATGTAREVVGRALRDLERRGAVRVERGRITICDRSLLEEIAGLAPE